MTFLKLLLSRMSTMSLRYSRLLNTPFYIHTTFRKLLLSSLGEHQVSYKFGTYILNKSQTLVVFETSCVYSVVCVCVLLRRCKESFTDWWRVTAAFRRWDPVESSFLPLGRKLCCVRPVAIRRRRSCGPQAVNSLCFPSTPTPIVLLFVHTQSVAAATRLIHISVHEPLIMQWD